MTSVFSYQLILKSVKQDQMLSSEKEVLNYIYLFIGFLVVLVTPLIASRACLLFQSVNP